MTKMIAFYLPQYHPIKENDEWYGKGFTEWTNVAKAKPLYKGHYQPHIPADLGFYDLRVPETRREQAKMAEQYGLSAFCYWNYWFGDGKQLLEMPIWEVYKDTTITFPFCLAWANHSWEKKMWDKQGNNTMLMEQKYLGQSDYTDYFYTMLPLFRDERYFRVNGKLFFIIYDPVGSDQIKDFIKLWRKLARKEGIGDFYFVGRDSACRIKEKVIGMGFDAVYDDNVINIHHNMPFLSKVMHLVRRKVFHMPSVFEYKDAIEYMITSDASDKHVIPVIAPNWDHSPRSSNNAFILNNSTPELFYKLVKKAIKSVSKKNESEQLVIIKAWNEWGEGNHLEPDLKYGKGYLEAIQKALEEAEW